MRIPKGPYRFVQRRRGSTHITYHRDDRTLCNQGRMPTSTKSVVPTRKRPLCKRCEAKAGKSGIWEEELKVEPCPRCGNEGIVLFNCGYSSFNPGGGMCPDCGFEVSEYVDWNTDKKAMARVWNRGAKDVGESPEEKLKVKLKAERLKARRLRRQLRDLGEEPVE